MSKSLNNLLKDTGMAFRVGDIKNIEPIYEEATQSRSLGEFGAMPIIEIGGRSLDELAEGALKSPLVSFVIINFNYSEFIADTINSIKRQDYAYFECIIIDNHSEDDSVHVIKRHIEGDSRFKLYQLPDNLGQLGATIWAISRIKGSFVVFVDADDILFPAFCSSHIQAHLALPETVPLTSSNLIDINRDGHVLDGRSSRMNIEQSNFKVGFRSSKVAPRISTIDDASYSLLEQRTAVVPVKYDGWCWTPGTSNMYRASFIKLFQFADDFVIPNRSNDGYFKFLAWGIAPTAIIDLPLSAYRIHGRNYWSILESISGLKQFNLEYFEKSKVNYHQTLEVVLSRSVELHWLTGNLWNLIDTMTKGFSRERRIEYYNSEPILNLFKKYAAHICDAVGERDFAIEVARRFGLLNGLKIAVSDDRGRYMLQVYRYLKEFMKNALNSSKTNSF
jgi:glycosyltransferase involved in cell wall biosynthesis